MKRVVTLPAVFSKPVFRADNSVKLEFDTREFTGAEATQIMDLRGAECWLAISPNDDITLADIPDEKADAMTGQKTQSQRLRAIIYVYWEQRGKKGSFEDFYKTTLETLIEFIKAKLD